MVSIQLIVGWFVIYTVAAILISKKYSTDDGRFSISGPILTFRSQFGLDLVRTLASKKKKAWGVWGLIGVISALITGVVAFLMIVVSVYGILSRPDVVGIQGPTDMLVIPGVNRFLPLSAAPELMLALLIAMVIHEGGHAIYCALGDIEIKSTGLIFGGLIPLGAFVEPSEKEQNEADAMDQLKMYSAGIMNNYALFVVTLVLVFVLVPILISPITGVAIGSVLDGSPADEAGLEAGDVVTQVNGEKVEQPSDISAVIGNSSIDQVTTNEGETYNVPDGAFVVRATEVSNLSVGQTVVSIDGQGVGSSGQFRSILADEKDPKAEVTYLNGDNGEIKVGTHVTAQSDDQLASDLNLSTGETTIIHEVNGEKVVGQDEFVSIMNSNRGEPAEITYWNQNGELITTEHSPEDADFESVSISGQTSGITTSNLGVNVYPKDQFYSILSFGDSVGSTAQNAYSAMILPITSIVPGVEFGLPGFTPFVQNFYTVSMGGPIVSTIVFFTISVFFWTAWINVNLAIFNCLPTFALDGGHILKALVWSAPGDLSENSEKYIILGLKTIALVPLLVLLIGPLYL